MGVTWYRSDETVGVQPEACLGEMFDQLLDHFREIGWPVEQQFPPHPIVSVTFQGTQYSWTFVGAVEEDLHLVSFFSRAPWLVPRSRFPAMLELISRANYGMMHGCFVLDFDDGELRFRVGGDMADLPMTTNLLQELILYNCGTMDQFLPAIRAVIDGLPAVQAMSLVFDDMDSEAGVES